MADPDQVAILRCGKSAWNDWRRQEPDVRPDLSNLKLDFLFPFDEEAHLGGRDFHDTSFEEADLEKIFFYDADEYMQTNLAGASLRGARLSGAHLHYVDLTNSDMSRAELGWTLIGDTNLSRTRGLAEVIHRFPSSIDVSTIERTFRDLKLAAKYPHSPKEGIPETRLGEVLLFFRNAGVPDHLIDYYAKFEPSMDFYSCFISYSHSDKEFVERLNRRLEAQGIVCWLDEHRLLPGDDLLTEIDRGIRFWDKLLLCCSKSSLESWWVDKEIEKSFQKEERLWNLHKKRFLSLIPLDLDGFIFNGWESAKASLLRSRYIADFSGWREEKAFDAQVRKLEKALRVDRDKWDRIPESRL